MLEELFFALITTKHSAERSVLLIKKKKKSDELDPPFTLSFFSKSIENMMLLINKIEFINHFIFHMRTSFKNIWEKMPLMM